MGNKIIRRMAAVVAAALSALLPVSLAAQETAPPVFSAPATVSSNEIDSVSVTIYRDPSRGDRALNLNYLRGFALISETRTIALPAGASTVRFEGVAGGMVAVSAVVTGLPGGVVQKNRDKKLLSPASLIDGTLGNRVTLKRTDIATGTVTTQDAIIRTGADGGVVLQTADGFEALRCAGLPETLVYDTVPAGLSAKPVLSVDTVSPAAQTVTVTLTYLASGFDWSAHYVGQLDATGTRMDLLAWITLANMNAESFADAEVMAVAGTLNIERPYAALADRPDAPRLMLTCYPYSSTSEGTPYEFDRRYGEYGYAPPPPPPPSAPPPVTMDRAQSIVVTGSRIARQEDLGDLKLYRVPFRSTVAAKAQKQVALLVRDDVPVQPVYVAGVSPADIRNESTPMQIELRMRNRPQDGLGLPLPSGGITVFAPRAEERLLLGETGMRDYAVDEKVEFTVARSAQVRHSFASTETDDDLPWRDYTATLTNANASPVPAELRLGLVGTYDIRRTKGGRVVREDGQYVWKARIPANGKLTLKLQMRGK